MRSATGGPSRDEDSTRISVDIYILPELWIICCTAIRVILCLETPGGTLITFQIIHHAHILMLYIVITWKYKMRMHDIRTIIRILRQFADYRKQWDIWLDTWFIFLWLKFLHNWYSDIFKRNKIKRYDEIIRCKSRNKKKEEKELHVPIMEPFFTNARPPVTPLWKSIKGGNAKEIKIYEIILETSGTFIKSSSLYKIASR